MTKRRWSRWIVILMGLTACAEPAPATPGVVETRLSGSVFFEGALSGREVTVFDFTGAKRGARLASGFSDERGNFYIDVGVRWGALLVETSLAGEGRANVLSAVVDDVEVGVGRERVRLTPVTHLSRTYAASLVAAGAPAAEVFLAARSAVHALFGAIDHNSVAPVDVQAVAGVGGSDGVVAGLLVAALLEQAEVLRQRAGMALGSDVSGAAFVSALALDIADGVFDGVDAAGVAIRFAGTSLDEQTLRVGLAAALVRFAESEKNLSGVRGAEVAALARAIRTNDGPLFPPGTAAPVDIDGPRFERAELRDRFGRLIVGTRPVGGALDLDVRAVDDDGAVAELRLEVGDVVSRQNGGAGRFTVETTALADGPRELVLSAVDAGGRTTRRVFAIVVDNVAPRLTAEAPDVVDTTTIAITGVVEAGPADIVVEVDGAPAARLVDARGAYRVIAPLPCGRIVAIQVWGEDVAMNRSAVSELSARCTATGPQIRLLPSRVSLEGDWAVERVDGQLVFSPPAAGAREAFVSETSAFPVRFEKFFNRLDGSSENLPAFQLAFSPDVARVDYRYLVNGIVRASWRALDVSAAGEATVAVAYGVLGTELLTRPGALHQLEVRARDSAGVTRTRAFTFELHIRSPPVWYTDCTPTGRLGWANLGDTFTESTTVAAFEGQLAFDLDLPSDTALDVASTPSVIARLTAPAMGSRAAALSEQTFVGPWSAPQTTSVWTMPCGIDDVNNGGYEVAEDWVTATVPVCVIGPSLSFPDERVFWRADVRGALSDPSPHAVTLELERRNGWRGVAAREERLVGDEVARLIVRLDAPRLIVAGETYDWRRTYAPLPSGFVAAVGTEDRYRWPGGLQHTGRELRFAGALPGTQRRYRERAFQTRAALNALEIAGPPVGVDVSAALGWSFLAVELRRDDSCAAMQRYALHE